MIKIGIDIHGVITKDPDFFRKLSKILIESGNEVHIITGGSYKDVIDELKSYDIEWTHFFSVYDFLIKNKSKTYGLVQFPDGTKQLKFKNDVWDRVKGDYCRDNKIDIHFDDTEVYKKYFTTNFCLF